MLVPPSGTRPTAERVREALFSRLEHYDAVVGATVLDLYAGSGALALESLSRGAHRAELVDISRRAIDLCNQNARNCGFRGQARATCASADNYLAGANQKFDLVFIDPPYDISNSEVDGTVAALIPHLRPAAVVVVERRKKDPAPTWLLPLAELSQKTYGDTSVYIADMPAQKYENQAGGTEATPNCR